MKFKVGDRIRYIADARHAFRGVSVGEEFEVMANKVDTLYWIVPGKVFFGSSLKHYQDSFELVEEIGPEPTVGPIKSDGGSSTYYDIELPAWLLERIQQRGAEGKAFIKTEELTEVAFGNDFAFGTLFKSLVRAYGQTTGEGKAGNTIDYELNKVVYYAENIRQRNHRTT